MEIKAITVDRGGVIPVAAYENLRIRYSITVEMSDGEKKEDVVSELQAYLREVFEHESNRAKAELLASQYRQIRWYEKDGRQYPSVTSIVDLEKKFGKLTDDELAQYAAQGTIIGKMVEVFLSTGIWIDPEKDDDLAEAVEILLGGSLNMHWNQCTYRAFCEKFAKDITAESIQKVVYNDEVLYAGTYDIVGTYKGKRTLFDVKRNTYDMRQLAAYAACLDGIEQLVVLPVGPTDNKCGYKNPVVCTTIQKEYEGFLKARAKFKRRFGI